MILITGGTGFIGSHTCVALAQAGQKDVLILDNFSNSQRSVLPRLEKISQTAFAFVEGDVRDAALLKHIFAHYPIESVIHFAAYKAVAESVEKPLDYYDNNVSGTIALLQAMRQANVKSFVFSSSATVYGNPETLPCKEYLPLQATNPYGRTKMMIELMLADIAAADPQWRIARLRYFNPVGAHESGLIGEDPQDTPNNLMPYLAQVAVGKREKLNIFGGDYDTVDGTGVRDYIHVMDLAEGHVAALHYLQNHPGLLSVNLGSGHGTSVLEMLRNFEAVCGHSIPYEIVARRAGDLPAYWADPALAQRLLGWQARRSALQMCADTWRWQIWHAKNTV